MSNSLQNDKFFKKKKSLLERLVCSLDKYWGYLEHTQHRACMHLSSIGSYIQAEYTMGRIHTCCLVMGWGWTDSDRKAEFRWVKCSQPYSWTLFHESGDVVLWKVGVSSDVDRKEKERVWWLEELSILITLGSLKVSMRWSLSWRHPCQSLDSFLSRKGEWRILWHPKVDSIKETIWRVTLYSQSCSDTGPQIFGLLKT